MDMSDDYVAGWRRRLSADKARRNIRAQEAASAAQKCAHLLYENYGVRKVYLFGSLNQPERFQKSGVRSSFDGFVPLVGALSNNADRRVAQPNECTDFLQCIIVPPLCGCWRSVE